jgi:hypothetical protein
VEPLDGGAEPPDPELPDATDPDRWLADQRVESAIAERRRAGWLGRQAGESATFTGVLRDLAERGSVVVIDGAGERQHRGRLVAVASDFVALERLDGELTLLRTDVIAAVRAADPGSAPVLGDRPPLAAQDLGAAITALAVERPRVVLVARDGTARTGELHEVGQDVALLRTDGNPPATSYVPLAFLAELSVVGSG